MEHLILLALVSLLVYYYYRYRIRKAIYQTSEERLRLVTDTASDGIVTTAFDSTILFINPAMTEIFGYTKEEMLGHKLTMLMSDEVAERHIQARDRYVVTRVKTIDWRAVPLVGRHKHGHVIPLEVSFGENSHPNDFNTDITFTGIIRDVTEKEDLRAKAIENQAKFEAVFNKAAVGLARRDLDGSFISVNPKLLDILGYPEEQVLPHNLRDIIHPKDLDSALELVNERIPLEKRALKQDGTLIWIKITNSVALNRFLKPAYFVTVVEDITISKKNEQAIREVKDMYIFLANTMPQIVWTATADGYRDYFNDRWYDLVEDTRWYDPENDRKQDKNLNNVDGQEMWYGLKPEERHNEGWLNILHPEDRERTIELWKESVRTSEPYQIEYRYLDSHTKTYMWYLARAVPMKNDKNEISMWVGTCTNIDDYKRSEEELRASNSTLETTIKELAESNKELSDFVHIASHDLQEPLRMVSNYLGLVETSLADKLDERTHKYIDFATGGARRMKVLIDDVLQFSRAGSRDIVYEEINLNNLIDNVFLVLLPTLQSEDGTLTIARPLPSIVANPSQIEQVFTNLITNGIKFTLNEPAYVRVEWSETDRYYEFRVVDNGIGIDKDHYSIIFDVFQRLHTREKYEGSGIGLSICKRIITRHGGKIWVDSELGIGTTFHFTIPKDLKVGTVKA